MLACRWIEARAGESVEEHYARAQRIGWAGPPDVLEVLFGRARGALGVGARFPRLDWAQIQWVEWALSPAELECVHIDRAARALVDEVRRRMQVSGEDTLQRERIGGWCAVVGPVRPVVLAGAVLGAPGTLELVAGFSVVGQWLGVADRATAPVGKLRVWLGEL